MDPVEPPRTHVKDVYDVCGARGHGRNSPTRVRRNECPAYGTKCSRCGKDHHLEKVCRSKQVMRPAKDAEHEDAVFDTLCEITSTDSTKSTALDHHVFDKFTKEWLRRRSKPQPYIRLQMSIRREDYDPFGFPPSEPNKVGMYVCLSCHTHTIRRPPAPVGPSHIRTRWCGLECIHYYMCHYNVCTFTPAPPPAPPHPPSSPCHIVTHTTLVTQVRVVAVDPTPQVR